MLANTGTISFLLYGVLIFITLAAMFIAIYYIKKDIDLSKLAAMTDLFKYGIASIAITTTTLIVSDLFKEREQDVKELEYFDKYTDDVKLANGISVRYELSKYLSIVAPSGELKKSWKNYYDIIKPEYESYISDKKKQIQLDTIKNPTKEQVNKYDSLKLKIELQETPLVSLNAVSKPSKDYNLANEWENKGFNYLIAKDVNAAIKAFDESEKAYNGYHQVYEISRYLKNNTLLLNSNSPEWINAHHKIANDFNWKMPQNIKSKLTNSK